MSMGRGLPIRYRNAAEGEDHCYRFYRWKPQGRCGMRRGGKCINLIFKDIVCAVLVAKKQMVEGSAVRV